jgi:Putative transposase
MTVEAEEFIRRFLLHVLPEGFQRIRYYGFLANRYREEKLKSNDAENYWTCRRQNHQPSKERIIVSVIKN